MELENKTLVATDVAEQMDERNENATVIDFKMVTFSLAEKDYSVDIMYVKEIAKASRFTYVPNTLPFVLGVYNLRGEIIPIIDLRLFFNIEIPPRDEDKLENMIILNVEDQIFGLVVDKIDKVVGVQKSTIQPPHPLFGDINIKYIDGVVESNKRLYVLLDVTRIFSSKENFEPSENEVIANQYSKPQTVISKPMGSSSASGASATAEKSSSQTAKGISQNSNVPQVDLKFISESLKNYSKFVVSAVNKSWVNHRYAEWKKQKNEDNPQINNQNDSDEFLKPFWSSFTNTWWSKQYAENLEKVLPDNSAKQIVVWNPGCGKGTETYSLACVLKKRYPNARVRIYAQDIDLLSVSNASLISVPQNLSTDWYAPFLTKKANGEYTFSQEIKDSIMFEYHDCKNANALPMVDIIFARDILSVLDENVQETVVSDFFEKMKGNGVVIIGENEAMPSKFNFGEKTVDKIVAYGKD